MQKITPCLWFDKNCEEAINFYVSTFAGSPNKTADSKIISIQRYPEEIMIPEWQGMQGKIVTAIFELNGQRFMALDGGPHFQPSGAISFEIECDDQDEVDYFWGKLTEGGNPEAQQCGWLQDKFGFSWQVTPKRLGELLSDPDKAKSDRVMKAMLKMKKIIIADLEAAAEA